MPINTTPCDCIRVQELCRKGISAVQGSHVDDQKFSTTAFPLRSARCSFAPPPESVGKVKSGAALPMSGLLISPNVVVLLVVVVACLFAGVRSCVQSRISSPAFTTLIAMKNVILRLRERFLTPWSCNVSGEIPSNSIAPLPELRNTIGLIMVLAPDRQLAEAG